MALCHAHAFGLTERHLLNEGNVVIDMIDRLRSLVKGVVGKRLTDKMLVHGI